MKKKPDSLTLSHLDDRARPTMVDVGEKTATHRVARARAIVEAGESVLSALEISSSGELLSKKGSVFQTAILAGIMAAKKTGDLIPLCHPIGLDNCTIHIYLNEHREIFIESTCSVTGKTGVEMEALTGVSIAALTIYDMCKALSHTIVIKEIRLLEKRGGKNDFTFTD